MERGSESVAAQTSARALEKEIGTAGPRERPWSVLPSTSARSNFEPTSARNARSPTEKREAFLHCLDGCKRSCAWNVELSTIFEQFLLFRTGLVGLSELNQRFILQRSTILLTRKRKSP